MFTWKIEKRFKSLKSIIYFLAYSFLLLYFSRQDLKVKWCMIKLFFCCCCVCESGLSDKNLVKDPFLCVSKSGFQSIIYLFLSVLENESYWIEDYCGRTRTRHGYQYHSLEIGIKKEDQFLITLWISQRLERWGNLTREMLLEPVLATKKNSLTLFIINPLLKLPRLLRSSRRFIVTTTTTMSSLTTTHILLL